MQYKQKNFLMSALVAVLGFALVTASGCTDGDSNNSKDDDANKVTVKVSEWKSLKNGTKFAIGTANKVDHLAASGNKWLYVASGASLFAVNGDKSADIADDAKWGKINFAATGLTPAAAKIADLTTSFDKIERLAPTSTGVMMSGSHTTASATAGAAALVTGNTVTATWAPVATNTTHVGVAGAADGHALLAGVLKKKNGKEYPYVQYVVNTFNANQNRTINGFIGDNTVVGALAVNYKAATAFAGADEGHHFVSVGSAGDTKSAIVTKLGIRVYADADAVGTDTAIADPVAEGVAARWVVDTGVAGNDGINAVAGSGDLIFVALKSNGSDKKGGVAVYNAKTPTSSPAAVHKGWLNVDVLNFAVDNGGKVWAVTKKALFEVKANGEQGAELKADADVPSEASAAGNYAKNGNLLPNDNITDAKFAGDALVIATNNNGIVIRMPAVDQKINKK